MDLELEEMINIINFNKEKKIAQRNLSFENKSSDLIVIILYGFGFITFMKLILILISWLL